MSETFLTRPEIDHLSKVATSRLEHVNTMNWYCEVCNHTCTYISGDFSSWECSSGKYS